MEKMYESLGISSRVYEFGQEIIEGLKPTEGAERNAEKPCERGVPGNLYRIWLQ